MLTANRISRYNTASSRPATAQDTQIPPGFETGGPVSPTSSLKTNLGSNAASFDPKLYSGTTQEARQARASRQSEPSSAAQPSSILQVPISGSPLATSQREPQWPADGPRELHLSGHEPRYLPGMMTRASRRDSLRQSSTHESDEINPTRSASKKNSGGGDALS